MRSPAAQAFALDPLRARWGALPDNVRGAVWILLSCLFISSMAALVKLLGSRLDSLQLSFFRALFGFLAILPFVAIGRFVAVRTLRLRLHVSRGLLGGTGVVCSFYAITHLPLAEATAIGFSKPLFMVVLAALVLGEVVRARYWSATAVGFLGCADHGPSGRRLAGAAAFRRPARGFGRRADLAADQASCRHRGAAHHPVLPRRRDHVRDPAAGACRLAAADAASSSRSWRSRRGSRASVSYA